MEVGSSSSSSSHSQPNSSSNESLNGLKFGQKIYFEDLGLGVGAGAAAQSKPKKVRGNNGFQMAQPPRCQVEGCNVDLSDAKAYYSRHKVCGMHSKSPKVIVAGLEQRFCQQCSRFHLLPEFDQGKRSCRRRLAGHNERRRKPQPRSLSSIHYSRLSSSFFGNSSKVGSFLMDFSSYPKLTGRDLWSSVRPSEQVPVNGTNNATGKYYPYLLQKNSENSLSSSDFFLQGSSGGTGFPDPGMPSGECIGGVTDSSCALSLLSNQPWNSENRTSSFGTNGTLHAQAAAPTGYVTTNGTGVSHFPATSWGFKTGEAIPSSHEMAMDLGLCQMTQPLHGSYAGEVELPQLSRRQYMEFGYSRTLDSTQQMHWSL